MAHSHAEAPAKSESTYFLDQLCTIAVAGLIGFTAIELYLKGWLRTKFGLIDRFHVPVLIGGILLIVLVVFRAIALWRTAGQIRSVNEEAHEDDEQCEHDHAHQNQEHDHGHAHAYGHEHAHSHGHEHSHDHGHSHGDEGHDHGWAPWQYAVLIIPAVLFFLELPRDGYNQTRLNEDLREVALDPGKANQRIALAHLAGSVALPAFKKAKQDQPDRLRFSELTVHASREQARDYFEGRTVQLEGQFRMAAGKDNEFQLFRVMVNCCNTDSIVLKSRIKSPEPLQGFKDEEWVRIEGEVSFQKVAGKNEWIAVIQLPSVDNIQKIAPPADPSKDV